MKYVNDISIIERLLLSKKVDVKATDEQGATALGVAAQRKDTDICLLLIRHKFDLNAANNRGVTALMACNSCGGCPAICESLVAAGANLDMQDHSGDSALMKGVKYGCPEGCSILIDAGADVTLINRDGVTAMEIIGIPVFPGKDSNSSLLRALLQPAVSWARRRDLMLFLYYSEFQLLQRDQLRLRLRATSAGFGSSGLSSKNTAVYPPCTSDIINNNSQHPAPPPPSSSCRLTGTVLPAVELVFSDSDLCRYLTLFL
jgi:hypothetical protein